MGKVGAVAILIAAEIAVLGLWFSSSAVLTDMAAEAGRTPASLAGLATAVQIGFAAGALAFAGLGLADRYDPRMVFCLSGLVASAATLGLLVVEIGATAALALRALTGAAMAGVYPVGMKIAVGWGTRDRGFLVGLLVGALTLGSASPHLVALLGGADWRLTLIATATIAALGAVAILATRLGPHHARAPRLDPGAFALAVRAPRLRLAILAYLGHMWELYAFWAWVGAIAVAGGAAAATASLTAFAAIALGGVACVPAGWLADRLGRARVAFACLVLSGTAGVAAALVFGGPLWLLVGVLIVWGIAVIPDSALYSTLVADAAPPERAGSLMTLQTALGFLLTAITVQGLPWLASAVGWPAALATLALGPIAGGWALRGLMRFEYE
ncbi:MAG: MFS transporter [Pseudomonadota bacterium]